MDKAESGLTPTPSLALLFFLDGTMHILSPIDPFFLVLALLNLSNSTFVPLEDLFDSAAASFYASRSERYNSLIPKNSTEIPVAEDGNGGASTWTDIIEFGKLKTTRGALERCCDVQGEGQIEVRSNVDHSS